MTKIHTLDLGLSHSYLKTRVGQNLGTMPVGGGSPAVWAKGGTTEEQPVILHVTPWQAVGGQGANTGGALSFMLRQLEQIAANSVNHPVYIAWTSTDAGGGAMNQPDPHDGWYVLTLLQPTYNVGIWSGSPIEVPVTATMVAPSSPASLGMWWAGAPLATTYANGTGCPQPILGFPVGSTPPYPSSRTGAEGAVPTSLPGPFPDTLPNVYANPVPFIRPGTIAGLFTGGVRVYDTQVSGGNAVPTNGTFLNSNWVQVYGTNHDFQGDCVVTNGLLLLLFDTGTTSAPAVYVWNTQLVTPAWALAISAQYVDTVPSTGVLRDINLERVGYDITRVRVVVSTPNNSWAKMVWRLGRAWYHAPVDLYAQNAQIAYNFALNFILANAGKIAWNDVAVTDFSVGTLSPTASGSAFGFGAVMSQVARSPLVGVLYQNPPSGVNSGQPVLSGTTDIGYGDSAAIPANTFRTYGVFAVPFATAPNLQAEGESGALGTGWSSVANAGASNGNEAKCASGTLSGNANLFGTAWQPVPSNASFGDVWFRLRVASAAGAVQEMTVGLWDATAGAFVANGSTTLRANQVPTTYGTNNWIKVNSTLMFLPSGHNIQFRAVTAATIGTDWFVDEAFFAPRTGAPIGNIGAGDWPEDIYSQFMFPLVSMLVPG